MSIYGECFDNGMNEKCNIECNLFQAGDCPIAEEFLEDLNDEELDEVFEIYPKLTPENRLADSLNKDYLKLNNKINEIDINGISLIIERLRRYI